MKIAMVKISDLNTDPSYQRDLDMSRIGGVTKAFNLGAMKAISVSERPDGQYFVYDGQHTVEVARACGMKSVPAVIVLGDQQKEAQWFILINGHGAKHVSQRGLQKAGVVACDELSGMAQHMLDAYKLEIGSSTLKVGQTNAIGAIKRYLQQSPSDLKKAMDAIQLLWPLDPYAWSGIVLRGMFEVSRMEDILPRVVLAIRKKKITPRRILDVASAMQIASGSTGGGSVHARAAVLKLCNIKMAGE